MSNIVNAVALLALLQRQLEGQELRIVVLIAMLHAFVLMILLSLPLARGNVKPNRLYGLRTRGTLADERVWYEANSYAGRLMIRGGIAGIVLALGLFFVPGMNELYVPVVLGALLLIVLAFTAWSVREARRIERRLRDADAGSSAV